MKAPFISLFLRVLTPQALEFWSKTQRDMKKFQSLDLQLSWTMENHLLVHESPFPPHLYMNSSQNY